MFRRGEQRIKERRRKRSRVLALCIPVCLIAAVWSIMTLPNMTLEGQLIDKAHAAGEMVDSAPECLACPYTALEIQDDGLFPAELDGTVTDPVDVAEIFSAVDSLFAETGSNGQGAIDNLPAAEDNGNRDPVDAANEAKGYTIIFTAEDGSQAVYRLSGNIFVNVSTDETIFLGNSQLAGLLAVLGLSE